MAKPREVPTSYRPDPLLLTMEEIADLDFAMLAEAIAATEIAGARLHAQLQILRAVRDVRRNRSIGEAHQLNWMRGQDG